MNRSYTYERMGDGRRVGRKSPRPSTVLRTSQPGRGEDLSKDCPLEDLASDKQGLALVPLLGSATGHEQPREMVASVIAAVDPEDTAAGAAS